MEELILQRVSRYFKIVLCLQSRVMQLCNPSCSSLSGPVGHTSIQKQGKEVKMFLISFSPSVETYPKQEE